MEYETILNCRISKLTLGTAQLGFQYGVSNRTGKPDDETARKILDIAVTNGVNCFDTAHAYGDSEAIIGSFLSSCKGLSNSPLIVSKLGPVEVTGKITSDNVYQKVRSQIEESLKRLQLTKIPIYLLHSAADLHTYNGLLIESLLRLKEQGLIGHLGASVYSPEEAEMVLQVKEMKAIQVPINIFDHRIIDSGILKQLYEKRIIVFARSLFLQGLLFINPDNLPFGMEFVRKPLIELYNLSSRHNISPAQMAVSFVRDLPEVTSIVIGAETPEQVVDNIRLLATSPISLDLRGELMDTFANMPTRVVNPSLWGIN